MAKHSPAQVWFQKYLEFHCDDCGCDVAFRSRRRSFTERFLLPLVLLRPVRCGECFRRDYRLVFMPVRERTPQAVKKSAGSAPTEANRNVA